MDDHGSYLLQVPAAAPGTTYYVEVLPDATAGANKTGAYLLGVDFRSTALSVDHLASSSLGDGNAAKAYTLQATATRENHFVLQVGNTGAVAAVRMVIFDSANRAVFVLTALAGQSVGGDFFLNQGAYRVVLTAATSDGSALPSLACTVQAKSITDPMDPIRINPIGQPLPPPLQLAPPTPLTISDPLTPDPALIVDPITNPWLPPPPSLA